MSTPVHEYVFEVWPDPMPATSYPILLPGRITVRAGEHQEALELAREQLQPGQALGACHHWRSRCEPAHR